MALNKGKKWEQCVLESWVTNFPSNFIYRLPDQQSGYKSYSKNPCDYFTYKNGKIILIECKTVATGNTINFSNLSQWESMLYYCNKYDNRAGFIVWFQDKGKVIWFGIKGVEKAVKEGKKSLSINMLNEDYEDFIDIPFTVKRVYPRCDLKAMFKEE